MPGLESTPAFFPAVLSHSLSLPSSSRQACFVANGTRPAEDKIMLDKKLIPSTITPFGALGAEAYPAPASYIGVALVVNTKGPNASSNSRPVYVYRLFSALVVAVRFRRALVRRRCFPYARIAYRSTILPEPLVSARDTVLLAAIGSTCFRGSGLHDGVRRC